ncbi:hypothetical protein [Chromobacterium vaccinii]|uniref:hypothetical protein n=1 Tax=Chromobacterium vaccinii TaxID=1108595 RepID=UPI001186AE4C|nr:hypothetical protein [Chromobacterium vaccinii]
MQFTNTNSLVGFALQMSETSFVKTQRFGEYTQSAWPKISQLDRKVLANEILLIIYYLPKKEQAALVAFHTQDIRAIKEVATLILPRSWDFSLRIELARSWACGQKIERSQKEIAKDYMTSPAKIRIKMRDAFSLISENFNQSLNTLEPLLSELINTPL